MASKIVITDVGISEILNASQTGTAPVTLTEVGFGTGIYSATKEQTALQSEFKRISAIAGNAVDDDVIHFTARDNSADAYSAYEIGVYTENGTLFAVYAQDTPIMQKAAGSTAMLAVDIKLTDISAANVTFGDTTLSVPPATETVQGVVELATIDETLEGTDEQRAVTPQGLNARVGVVESFVQNEVLNTINDLNERISNQAETPFCVNQGPMTTEGVPDILQYVNDIDYTAEVAFQQPILAANGALGGDSFAVQSNQNNDWAYYMFSSLDADWGSMYIPSIESPVEITIYNPEPLKVDSVSIQNGASANQVWSSIRIYGSNDGAGWTLLKAEVNGILAANALANVHVEAANAYKYIKLSFTSNTSNAIVAVRKVTLNATVQKIINGGRVWFRGPFVATTAQGDTFVVPSVLNLNFSQTVETTAIAYIDRSGSPAFITGEMHTGVEEPLNPQTGDIWFKTLEPLACYQWYDRWVETFIVPIGEVYLDGVGRITGVSTYPYNQNGYSVNSYTKATATTFGLTRVAAEEDVLNCQCNEASVTPSTLYKMAEFRTAQTEYAVGDTVGCPFHHDLYLKCITGGTTGADALDTRNVNAGDVLTDGDVNWQVCRKLATINNISPDEAGNVKIPQRYIGDEWVSYVGKIPAGGVPYCGQEVTRETYSALWSYAQAGGLVKTEAEWQEIATANNGNVPFYSDGDGSTTFRMPKIVGYVKGASSQSEAGSYVAEGLPNIVSGLSASIYTGIQVASGAFYGESETGGVPLGNTNASGKSYRDIYFDASRVSSVYGNSDHVTPETSVVMFGVYAFGAIANAGELDANTLATGLATLESNLEAKLNNSTIHIIETWRSDDGSSWYRKWSDGWIEQGGNVSKNGITITLCKSFSNAEYSVFISANKNSSASGATNFSNRTTTSFYANADVTSGNGCWYACGY